jgi:hypothetical protein
MEIAAAELPAEVGAAIARHGCGRSHADVSALTCRNANTRGSAVRYPFVFWTEIDAWAGRLVREVHALYPPTVGAKQKFSRSVSGAKSTWVDRP